MATSKLPLRPWLLIAVNGCLGIIGSVPASHHKDVGGPRQQFSTGDDCDQ